MMQFKKLSLILAISSIGCVSDKKLSEAIICGLDYAQGQMCGELTSSSVILQSRLTCGREFIDGDIPGKEGMACFQISKNLAFPGYPQSQWVPAEDGPIHDVKSKGARSFAENPDWQNYYKTPWIKVTQENDFIIKQKLDNLRSGTRYYYRLLYGPDKNHIKAGRTCTFKTHDSPDVESKKSFVVVTGMNYYFFYYGAYSRRFAYEGSDRFLGFPALKIILDLQPDFFVGTGDNVYYDHPGAEAVRAKTKAKLRAKWHEQFSRPRFREFFAQIPTYWEKDDHDFRYNDCDNTTDKPPGPELGRKIFIEQLPIVAPQEKKPVTYRTHRVNKLLQIWLVEGRDYRSPNEMPDGPEKTLWGKEQIKWLKETLLESDAVFKILISPTPLIGPDDGSMGKRDNHTNIKGFRYERDAFFKWLVEKGFPEKNFYIVCGDRHWQYHSIHPTGLEEFSCGALVQANSRLGPRPGEPKSNDPQGLIKQPHWQEEASAGFLKVTVEQGNSGNKPTIYFDFYDEFGESLYSHKKFVKD